MRARALGAAACVHLFRRRLNRLTQELAQLIKRSLGIQYEPLQAARGTM
jgi:hypothetical protein